MAHLQIVVPISRSLNAEKDTKVALLTDHLSILGHVSFK